MTYLILALQLLTVVVATLHDVVLQLFQTDVVVFALTRLGVGRRQLVAQVRRRRRERLGRRAGRVTRRRFDQDAAVVRRRARLVHCGGGRQKSETWRVVRKLRRACRLCPPRARCGRCGDGKRLARLAHGGGGGGHPQDRRGDTDECDGRGELDALRIVCAAFGWRRRL